MSFFDTGKQQIAEVQSWFIYSEINTATVTHVCLKITRHSGKMSSVYGEYTSV